ncbi:MAG TPA: GNAT family N-acetyltransferase [Candidatus Kapabacteria bacterium]|nr:GNAT family N-acetyltransferase [Candidatus Kapabacteria bacterium]
MTSATPDFFVSPPEIVTERLLLRGLHPDDAPAIFEYCSRDNVTKYVVFPTHQSVTDSEAFIDRATNGKPLEFGVVWAIVLRDSGKLIGTIGIHKINLEQDKLETGYALHDDYWNKGYTTEALRALIGEIFTKTSINRIEALHAEEHTASGAVMQKSGMSYEGTLREASVTKGKRWNMKVFSILKREWEASKDR